METFSQTMIEPTLKLNDVDHRIWTEELDLLLAILVNIHHKHYRGSI